jgi:general secretion pathway protein A
MLEFYGLKEKPFSLLPTPRFIYLSESYLETKAKLLYFLKDKSASLYLYGPIGSGKTSLLRLIAQEANEDPSTNAQYLIAPNLRTANQLLRLICEGFGVKTHRSYVDTLQNLESYLLAQAKAGISPLLLIDEAQNLNRDELKLIHYLLNYVSNEQVLLMIVLVGQPELSQRIARFPSLKSRLISSSLTEMTRADMERMIRFRWTVAAGGDAKSNPPFTKKAYDAIYGLTKGNPRLVVKLCHAALLQGLMAKAKPITAKLARKAHAEL